MFKMFPFKFWRTVNIGNLGNMIGSFLEDIDLSGLIDEFEQEYDEKKFNESQEPEDSKGKDVAEFIQLEEYEDMYILTIELNGVDLRQTSIQYNPGKLSINLNKMEKVSQHIGMFSSDYMVKKNYKKEFDKIESIDESKIMKILENGVLKISMPKKYALNDDSKIVDVKNYIEN
ncbi:Hsp20/alpha crystallin family protein [Clostridium botulinum]|uniref:Hsp20/alpha crystallin family protein n=1 Tax=Clostridium botulinum TaxID=1491 RepID=UPI0013CCBEF3|nr:Hsp20 family protein [Clostridium botulinum]MBN1043627.1 Hsp20/alpha crystallin family protein [Clostridium botulinum]MBN1050161.1 Hsp20/alpha crystallin family protein [Clostridium botulinum]MBY6839057.1 Hsp20/alpha crystallin family protein [Clostridium botulinum]MBY6917909.1 Hsp20/alpha crystallin family protein [Clostridium botulinum]NFG65496.1 Hsp20/alpha crystallin family protein [Clostridium botulinum]